MIKIIGVLMLIILMVTPLSAQNLERLFYSDYYFSVEEGMRIDSQKHAAYTYILSNASTPGVDLFSLLPPDDKILLKSRLPDNEDKRKEVIVEFVVSQMARNNKHLAALTTIWGNKAKSLKNVVTLGK